MTKNDQRERRALWRFGVVSRVRVKTLGGISLADAVREVAAEDHADPDDGLTKVTERSIRRWVASYEKRGFDGLHDKKIETDCPSRTLGKQLLDFVRKEKTIDPTVSIPQVIKRARADGALSCDERVSRVTVYRAAKRMGLPLPDERHPKKADQRPFAYEHRMQMVLVDGKNFYAGPKKCKRVAITMLDDATRKGLRGIINTAETARAFLILLFETIMFFGFMAAIYFDRGTGFKANDTRLICARLGIALIFGTKGYPPGRGKIERFHRTLSAGLLVGLDGNAAVDIAPSALTLLYNHYLQTDYNLDFNEGPGGVPDKLFEADQMPLRMVESEEWLRRQFVITETRKVRDHNVVSIKKRYFEMPLGYAGRTVKIYRHVIDDKVFVDHDGRQIELFPCDPHANARDRSRRAKIQEPVRRVPVETAAMRTFRATYGPMVGPDGGFPDTRED